MNSPRDIGIISSRNWEQNYGEIILRMLEWDSKKKLIFKPHSIIVKLYCDEVHAYLSGELKSTCWDCRIDASLENDIICV